MKYLLLILILMSCNDQYHDKAGNLKVVDTAVFRNIPDTPEIKFIGSDSTFVIYNDCRSYRNEGVPRFMLVLPDGDTLYTDVDISVFNFREHKK